MIEKWFETFTLLQRHSLSDETGGEIVSFTPVTAFRGLLTYAAGETKRAAGQFALSEQTTLLHEFDITLSPGDYVRREKDGAVYRVADHSARMQPPPFSGLQFTQVPVERTVLPC